jgi:hypothetical protein
VVGCLTVVGHCCVLNACCVCYPQIYLPPSRLFALSCVEVRVEHAALFSRDHALVRPANSRYAYQMLLT